MLTTATRNSKNGYGTEGATSLRFLSVEESRVCQPLNLIAHNAVDALAWQCLEARTHRGEEFDIMRPGSWSLL